MPNLEWECPHELVSPSGPATTQSINFNTIYAGTSGPVPNCIYLLQPDAYKIVPLIRVTADNVSQQDGSVLHARFTSGLQATLKVLYAIFPDGVGPDMEPACAADLRLMHEFLMVNVQSLLRTTPGNDPNTGQRLIWTPTGAGDTRILQAIQTLAWAEPSRDGQETFVEFEVESPFPYAINGTPTPVSLASGVNHLIPNNGDAPYYPVWRVASGVTTFTITNLDTLDTITYNGASIGGTFAEIITFDGTIFQDGSGADLSAGLDPTATDFFPIAPGGTNVKIVGSSMTVEAHDAFC